MSTVKFRLNDPRLAPRRTKLEIPGWAGKREPRADGSREQVWHCVPFSEGAQYLRDRASCGSFSQTISAGNDAVRTIGCKATICTP
jgi:hypothetical protein